ncbi:hypothetical protein IID23_02845 [Patescibacteria group bacterium]|nr:hypothetical protein [Patescibacteria group bacterium]
MKLVEKFIGPTLIIVAAVGLRLVPHLPNFAPIGALALFGGAYIKNKYALLIIFGTLLVSDYLLLYINPFSSNPINFSQFHAPWELVHSTIFFVYLSFLINFLIGRWIATNKSLNRIVSGALLSSVQFFVITNFGVWLTGMYGIGLSGLIQTYIMAIPFFRGTLFGDFFYIGLFFGGYELLLRWVKKPKLAVATG